MCVYVCESFTLAALPEPQLPVCMPLNLNSNPTWRTRHCIDFCAYRQVARSTKSRIQIKWTLPLLRNSSSQLRPTFSRQVNAAYDDDYGAATSERAREKIVAFSLIPLQLYRDTCLLKTTSLYFSLHLNLYRFISIVSI